MSDIKRPKCIATTRKPPNSKRETEEYSQCTRFALAGGQYCKNHQSFEVLTEEHVKAHTKYCSQCNAYKYFTDMSYGTCDDDRRRGVEKREGKRLSKIEYPSCVICTFTGGNERIYPNYCNKHAINGLKADIEQRGLKWCKNIIRGCQTPELSLDYLYSKCEKCLEANREADKQRRSFGSQIDVAVHGIPIVPTASDVNKKIIIDSGKLHDKTIDGFYTYEGETGEGKHCSRCGYFREKSEFIGLSGKYVDTCIKMCRSANHKADAKRDRSDRDFSEYESRPEVKARRKQWKETHLDQCRLYWQKYRAKKIVEDQEGYMAHIAEVQIQYRKNHPEKFAQMSEDAKKDPKRKESIYRSSANSRGIQFNLTSEQCTRFFMDKCFYCGVGNIDGFLNGIDRLDSDGDYDTNNCVTSCTTCNLMKNCLDPLIFVDMCEHILVHQGIKTTGSLHPEIFPNYVGSCFNRYKYSANKKHRDFQISINDFDIITQQPCYLCGKATLSGKHCNGIDRFDSSQGYILENCRPCCGNCNYLKKNTSYEQLIDHLVEIVTNNSIREIVDELDKRDSCITEVSSQPEKISDLDELMPDMTAEHSPQSDTSSSLVEPMKQYRIRKSLTKAPRTKLTPEERKEKERVRKQEYRAKKKRDSVELLESLEKKS